MDHSADNSCPLFPLEDLAITCPEISFWDSPLDQLLYPQEDPHFGVLNDDSKGEAKEAEEAAAHEAGGTAKQKKVMHRDIERQRRQEMSGLYASLRSVLPAEVLKGKRSISDQIHEATKYIKFVENRIRDLGSKRDASSLNKRVIGSDELMLESSSERGACSRIVPPAVVVTVDACSMGVQVLISGDFVSLPLSRVLRMLTGEGLDVVSCNYTKSDGRSCYMIQLEVRGGCQKIHLQMLQRKLTALINTLVDAR